MKFFLTFLFTTLLSLSAFSQLKVNLNNIDDTGFSAVINPKAMESGRMNSPDKLPVHFRVDWDQANKSGSQDLFDRIPKDGGILVVGLWNKVFDGLWGGKYSYSISAYLNGSRLFSDSKKISDNTEGMKYFKVYAISRSGEAIDLELESYEIYDMLWEGYSARFSGEGGAGIDWQRVVEEINRM